MSNVVHTGAHDDGNWWEDPMFAPEPIFREYVAQLEREGKLPFKDYKLSDATHQEQPNASSTTSSILASPTSTTQQTNISTLNSSSIASTQPPSTVNSPNKRIADEKQGTLAAYESTVSELCDSGISRVASSDSTPSTKKKRMILPSYYLDHLPKLELALSMDRATLGHLQLVFPGIGVRLFKQTTDKYVQYAMLMTREAGRHTFKSGMVIPFHETKHCRFNVTVDIDEEIKTAKYCAIERLPPESPEEKPVRQRPLPCIPTLALPTTVTGLIPPVCSTSNPRRSISDFTPRSRAYMNALAVERARIDSLEAQGILNTETSRTLESYNYEYHSQRSISPLDTQRFRHHYPNFFGRVIITRLRNDSSSSMDSDFDPKESPRLASSINSNAISEKEIAITLHSPNQVSRKIMMCSKRGAWWADEDEAETRRSSFVLNTIEEHRETPETLAECN